MAIGRVSRRKLIIFDFRQIEWRQNVVATNAAPQKRGFLEHRHTRVAGSPSPGWGSVNALAAAAFAYLGLVPLDCANNPGKQLVVQV